MTRLLHVSSNCTSQAVAASAFSGLLLFNTTRTASGPPRVPLSNGRRRREVAPETTRREWRSRVGSLPFRPSARSCCSRRSIDHQLLQRMHQCRMQQHSERRCRRALLRPRLLRFRQCWPNRCHHHRLEAWYWTMRPLLQHQRVSASPLLKKVTTAMCRHQRTSSSAPIGCTGQES